MRTKRSLLCSRTSFIINGPSRSRLVSHGEAQKEGGRIRRQLKQQERPMEKPRSTKVSYRSGWKIWSNQSDLVERLREVVDLVWSLHSPRSHENWCFVHMKQPWYDDMLYSSHHLAWRAVQLSSSSAQVLILQCFVVDASVTLRRGGNDDVPRMFY